MWNFPSSTAACRDVYKRQIHAFAAYTAVHIDKKISAALFRGFTAVRRATGSSAMRTIAYRQLFVQHAQFRTNVRDSAHSGTWVSDVYKRQPRYLKKAFVPRAGSALQSRHRDERGIDPSGHAAFESDGKRHMACLLYTSRCV